MKIILTCLLLMITSKARQLKYMYGAGVLFDSCPEGGCDYKFTSFKKKEENPYTHELCAIYAN